jgi:microcystin-dependent protein
VPPAALANRPRRAAAFYTTHEAASAVPMDAGTVAPTGARNAHENTQPSLAIGFVIALAGLFPSRN